jgi:alpha-tubulin suppressor-like RCC1 family protein
VNPTFISANGNVKKVAAGEYFSLILKTNGAIFTFGRNNVRKNNMTLNVGRTIGKR